VLVAEVPLIDARTLAGRIGQAFPIACAGLLVAAGLLRWRDRQAPV